MPPYLLSVSNLLLLYFVFFLVIFFVIYYFKTYRLDFPIFFPDWFRFINAMIYD